MAAVAASGLVGKGRDISLAALQRHDPYINRIVDVASQVALYTFGHRANEWEKTDVEGTLFVYTRSASPKHGFTIMNRLSMENRTEPITKDLDFQLQDPFLLYRNARCESFLLHWVVLLLKFGCMPLCLNLVSAAMGGVCILTNANV
uniref:5'-(N(7)-methylguanosine 5'-triphospho)-[mRNA] hydrolase n=1 Tax=Callithrix jacchus TaxID=9483 RepID=A0A5F4WB33_CALJA